MDPTIQKAHFYRRASFGATLAELEDPRPPQDVLNQWLQTPLSSVTLPTVDVADLAPASLRSLSEAERKDLRQQYGQRMRGYGRELLAWELEQMVTATNPLHERVTNLWRDHFVVAMTQSRPPTLIAEYDQRLRKHALGDFRDLLWSVSTSPAMLVYLNNHQNQADNINENFSRELLELFTVGPGHYTETDIQEGARALTGWRVQRRFRPDFASRFQPRFHDAGLKTYLGQQGSFTLDDVVDIVANHPATARTVATRFWTEFGYPDPEPELIDRLAQIFTTQNRSIAALVAAVFTSPEFYSPKAYRSRLKSPLYFVVGSIRQLELQANYPQLLNQLRTMGQPLYNPPSVKGWPADQGWLNSASLLNRLNLAQRMTDDYGDEGGYVFDPSRFTPERLITLLADGDTDNTLPAEVANLSTRDTAALILASPLYQLA